MFALDQKLGQASVIKCLRGMWWRSGERTRLSHDGPGFKSH